MTRLLAQDRVVSDLSRFDYEKHFPRKRSRNTSPTEIKSSPISPIVGPSRQNINDASELNLGKSAYDMRDELYDFYNGQSQASLPRDRPFTSYPTLIRAPHSTIQEPLVQNRPLPPPKDFRALYGSRNILQARHDNQDLPSMQDPRDYMAHRQDLIPQRTPVAPHYDAEMILLGRLMNRPLLPSCFDDSDDPGLLTRYTFTANNVIDFFQIAFGVIITTIASVLAATDDRIDAGFYRYFIAVGVVVLVVALLFITKTINFERRKGLLYCLLACVLTGVALILSISSIATDNNCYTTQICKMRKVLSSFSILSFFLWICTLIVFLTVFHIAKLISLKKINLDYDSVEPPIMAEKLRRPSYYKDSASLGYLTDTTEVEEMRNSQRYSQLANYPNYYFDENGKMYPLERNQDLRGTKPIIVYAPETLFC